MDVSVQTHETLGNAMSWLGSAHAVDTGEPVELDLALFDIASVFTDGFIPSGVVLARRTSDGAYGAYDPGTVTNEVQSLVATGGTAGDFTLNFDGEVTAAIAYNANAAAVEAALEALSNIGPPDGTAADVTVTGGPLPETPVVITFGGQYADEDVPALVVVDNVTDGNAVITTGTAGGGTGAGAAGLTVAKGHLLFPISVVNDQGVAQTTGRRLGAMLTHGKVRVAKLPTGHGLDQAAKDALPLIRYIDGDVVGL